jgi:hypothetical protein
MEERDKKKCVNATQDEGNRCTCWLNLTSMFIGLQEQPAYLLRAILTNSHDMFARLRIKSCESLKISQGGVDLRIFRCNRKLYNTVGVQTISS